MKKEVRKTEARCGKGKEVMTDKERDVKGRKRRDKKRGRNEGRK